MNQTQLTRWTAGFFDGDGHIAIPVHEPNSSSPSLGALARVGHSYVSGLFDAEGCVKLDLREAEKYQTGYFTIPKVEIGHSINDELMERLKNYSNTIGVNPTFYHYTRENRNHNDTFVWHIQNRDDVSTFIESIYDHSIVKKPQFDILLNEIIPRLDQGIHLDKRGFMKVIAWRDVLNSYKGGNRGEYNLNYFESKWGMNLQKSELPEKHPRNFNND